MTVLVTGANGFVGAAVCRLLDAAGTPFMGLVRKNAFDSRLYACDLSEPGGLRQSNIHLASAVVHCAAELPDGSRTDFTSNITNTINLLNALGEDVRVFILLSSVSVYDRSNTTREYEFNEESYDFVQSGYGHSKLAQERLVADWCRTHSVRLVVFRPSSIYGVGARPNTLLPRICLAAVKNSPIELFAPRNYRQNFVCIKDVAGIVCETLIRDNVEGVFNLFSDDTYSAVELANLVVSIVGSASKIVEHASREIVSIHRFNNARLHQAFGPNFTKFECELQIYCNQLVAMSSTAQEEPA